MKIDINIFVSVFNHENSIQKCLESILNQKTRYTYKIICLDDCSSDKSYLILQKFQNLYPNKMELFRNEHNSGSFRRSLIKSKDKINFDTKYWSIIDGDDWLLDMSKLEDQINFLESNNKYIGCGGKTNLVNEENKLISIIDQSIDSFNLKDLIMLEGKENLYMHISSITYRNVYFQKEKFIAPLKKYAKISGDTALLFLMLNFDTTKEIFCMKKIVSQYNYTKKGKWSKMSLSQQKRFNFFNFLNYIKLVSFKYKILIILKKFRIIS